MGLTVYSTYKHITWGAKKDVKRGHYVFHPLYDWSYTDIWKAIHEGGWDYCHLYDREYQYGIPVIDMRVSNVNHEPALRNLFFMQEFEPKTWNRITQRLAGLHAVAQLRSRFIAAPKELPVMFSSWQEYRDHRLENLITDPKIRGTMRKQFASNDRNFSEVIHHKLWRQHIACILSNDYHGTKLNTFVAANGKYLKGGKFKGGMFQGGKLIKEKANG